MFSSPPFSSLFSIYPCKFVYFISFSFRVFIVLAFIFCFILCLYSLVFWPISRLFVNFSILFCFIFCFSSRFYFILFYFIIFILFYFSFVFPLPPDSHLFILFYFVLFILFYFILFYFISFPFSFSFSCFWFSRFFQICLDFHDFDWFSHVSLSIPVQNSLFSHFFDHFRRQEQGRVTWFRLDFDDFVWIIWILLLIYFILFHFILFLFHFFFFHISLASWLALVYFLLFSFLFFCFLFFRFVSYPYRFLFLFVFVLFPFCLFLVYLVSFVSFGFFGWFSSLDLFLIRFIFLDWISFDTIYFSRLLDTPDSNYFWIFAHKYFFIRFIFDYFWIALCFSGFGFDIFISFYFILFYFISFRKLMGFEATFILFYF